MKISAATIFATALYASKALAETTIEFFIESGDESVNDHGLVVKNGTSGVDFVYVGDTNYTESFTYDNISDTMYYDEENDYELIIWDHFVQVSNDSGTDIVGISDGGYLTVNGSSDGFYGCMNVNEPYGHSSETPAIMYEPTNSDDCIALKIKAE